MMPQQRPSLPPSGPPMPPIRPPTPAASPFATGLTAIGLIVGVVIGVPIAVVITWFLWPAAGAFGTALADLIDAWPNVVAAAFLLSLFAWVVVKLFGGVASVKRAFAQARKERVVKLQNGLPIDVIDLPAVTRATLQPSLQAHYGVKMREAEREHPALRSYVNSPRIAHAPPAALPEVVPALPAGVPSFAQLLDSGKIGAGQPLILGFDAQSGQPITGAWSKLFSTGLGGMTGSGKSWCAAFLLAQSAAQGAKLILIDPHAGDDESLATRLAGLSQSFVCDVAQSGVQIENALKLASRELEQRKSGAHAAHQIILVCDEWTSLLRYAKLGELLTATALDICEQGRKYGLFGMFCAQAWQIDAASAVRDRLASHYCLRTRPDQFRYQTGLRGAAPTDTMTLKPGEAYFLSVAGELEKIVVPHMTTADLGQISGYVKRPIGFHLATNQATAPAQQATIAIAAQASTVANGKPDGSQMVAKPNQATTAVQRPGSLSPEAVRAAGLFVAGASPADVVKELRGVSSSQGRAYQAALGEVLQLIRDGMRGA